MASISNSRPARQNVTLIYYRRDYDGASLNPTYLDVFTPYAQYAPRTKNAVSRRFFRIFSTFCTIVRIIVNELNTEDRITGDFVIYDPFDAAQDMFINYY